MYRLQRNFLPFVFLLFIGCDSPSTDSGDIKEEIAEADTSVVEPDTIFPEYGGEGETPEPEPDEDIEGGTGEGHSPYSVIKMITLGEGIFTNFAYVRGYIVGSVDRSAITGSLFGIENAVRTNLLLADSPREKDYKRCISVELSEGNLRNALNLVDNPERLGQRITVSGVVAKYMYIPGIRSLWSVETPD